MTNNKPLFKHPVHPRKTTPTHLCASAGGVCAHVCGEREMLLTLAKLCLRNSFPDDAAGIIDHCGGFKLHRFDHIPHTNF